MSAAYLTTDDARTRAATLSGLAAIAAASDADLGAALLEASDRVDLAGPYQGVKYDLTPGAQPREFPRVPYFAGGGWYLNGLTLPPGFFWIAGGIMGPAGFVEIWDMDSDGNVVVPDRVLVATLYEAAEILAGDKLAAARDAIHAGITSKSFGGVSQSYRADGCTPVLCRRAAERIEQFRLKQGEAL